MTYVGNVSYGVSWHVQYLELEPQGFEDRSVAFSQRSRGFRYFLGSGTKHGNLSRTRQGGHAADVIGVSMRDQDSCELQSSCDLLFDWVRVAGIDRHHLFRILRRMDEPNVIVCERSNGRDLQHFQNQSGDYESEFL